MKITLTLTFLLILLGKVVNTANNISADAGTEIVDISPGNLKAEEFYNLIMTDQCNPITMTASFIAENGLKGFDAIDPSGLNRIPLHVAIDNKKLNCIRFIKNHFCAASTHEEVLQRERELLQKEDLRGWRAIEHAIENYPFVESLVLPEDDLSDPEKIKGLIKFAMKSSPLRSLSFLTNLTTRFPDQIVRVHCVLFILEEFLQLPEPSSQMSLLFLEQFLENVNFPVLAEGLSLGGDMKELFRIAIEKRCVVVLRRKELVNFMQDSIIEELIHMAIDGKRPVMAREIFETWKKLAGEENNKCSKFLFDLYYESFQFSRNSTDITPSSTESTVEITPLTPRVENNISYLKTLHLAFFFKLFEIETVEPFMIKFDDFQNLLNEEQRRSLVETVPKLWKEAVPSVLLIALHNPEMFDTFYDYKPELFTEFLHLIACYAPDSYPTTNLTRNQIEYSLIFVTSSKDVCNSTATMKSRAIKKLLNLTRTDHATFAIKKLKLKLGWEIIHPLLYGASSEDLLEVIKSGIKGKYKESIMGAAEMRNEPIPYTVLFNFLIKFEASGLSQFVKLLEYGEPVGFRENEQELLALGEIKRILELPYFSNARNLVQIALNRLPKD